MVKQVIVMRTDLGMNVGKMCAQAAHAGRLFIIDGLIAGEHPRENFHEWQWMTGATDIPKWNFGEMKTIVLGIGDLISLVSLKIAAHSVGFKAFEVIDKKLGVMTCLAIGPDKDELIDRLTGHLKLLKEIEDM